MPNPTFEKMFQVTVKNKNNYKVTVKKSSRRKGALIKLLSIEACRQE